jgi:ABC-type polysaccharide/polyol phosphate export permease
MTGRRCPPSWDGMRQVYRLHAATRGLGYRTRDMTTPGSDALRPAVRVATSERSPVSLIVEGINELLSRRRLIRYMVSANMKRTHVDTVLGQVWWVLDPLLQMAIYVVLIEIILNRGTPDYPLFIFAAILPWKWLSISLGTSTGSITGREGLIRQVQFPKIVLPAAGVLTGTVSFAISLIALGLMFILYTDRLSPWLLAIPLVAVVQFAFSIGLGFILAAVNTFYRDVQNILGHVIRLWFYASPGLWSFQDHLEDSPLRGILMLNPMAPILESYRSLIYGTTEGIHPGPDFFGLAMVFLFSIGLILVGILLFKRMEPAFAKVV